MHTATDPKIAQILIKAGANVNHQDKWGQTPLHVARTVEIAKLLIAHGADLKAKDIDGKTPVMLNTDDRVVSAYLKTAESNFEIEYNHSCAPVTDAEILDFCNNDLQFMTPSDKITDYKDLMFQSLKEVCRTPTGRMAFRATRANVQAQKKKDSNYRLGVAFDLNPNSGCFGCVQRKQPNTVVLCPNAIKKNYKDHAYAIPFKIGSVFLHEAMHVRQNQQGYHNAELNMTLYDATTTALSRQIAVESPYDCIRRTAKISDKELESYRTAVQYDPKNGQIDFNKARDYSVAMQKKYARDFWQPTSKAPAVNHAIAIPKIQYFLEKDVHIRLLFPDIGARNKPQMSSFEDINIRSGLMLSHHDVSDDQIFQALSPLAKNFLQNNPTNAQRQHLLDCLKHNKPLDMKLFKGKDDPVYLSASAYFNTSLDIYNTFLKLGELSAQIHKDANKEALDLYQMSNYKGNPHPLSKEEAFQLIHKKRQQLFEESRLLRKRLKKYGIDIATHNEKNERVADSVDMAKKKAPNEKENPVLPHEKAPQSDATRAMAEFQSSEGENTAQMTFTNNTRMS